MRYFVRQKAAMIAAFCAMLSGCGSSGGTLRPLVPSQPLYKHSLVVTGDMETAFVEALNKTPLGQSAVISNAPEPGGLQLQLDFVARDNVLASSTPALAGKLTRQRVTPTYTLRYTLSGTDGKMVAASEVTQKGQSTIVFMPRLSAKPLAAHKEDVDALVLAAAQQLVPLIQVQPWRARVVGESGPNHVVIAAGKASGLNYGDNFQTETQPVATLQVVTLDTTPEGQSRATLRLISGRLPAVGRALIPALMGN